MKDWARDLVHDVIENKKIEQIELLIQLIRESEEAKQTLRNMGYGWTGLSLLETIKKEVPNSNFRS
jgi:hypothetical protein